jgi:hypothetical protein
MLRETETKFVSSLRTRKSGGEEAKIAADSAREASRPAARALRKAPARKPSSRKKRTA